MATDRRRVETSSELMNPRPRAVICLPNQKKAPPRRRGQGDDGQPEGGVHAPDGDSRRRAMKASNSSRSFARLSSSTNSAKARASSLRRRRSASSRSSSRRRYSSKAKLPVDEKCGRMRKPSESELKFFSKNVFTSFGTG